MEKIKVCKQMEQVANIAVLQTNIRYVQKGRVSAEEAATDCNLSVDEILKKKEEYEKTKH